MPLRELQRVAAELAPGRGTAAALFLREPLDRTLSTFHYSPPRGSSREKRRNSWPSPAPSPRLPHPRIYSTGQ